MNILHLAGGQVIQVDWKREDRNNSWLHILSLETQRQYKVHCPYPCPARKGDVISGFCTPTDNGLHVFVRCPVVEPPASKEAVQTSFIIALRKAPINKWLSNKLYDFFKEQTLRKIDQLKQQKNISSGTAEFTILRNRDSLNAAVMETISWFAFRFQTDSDVALPLIELGLSQDQATKLLSWWHRELTLRRLYLLGLTRKEIRNICDRGWPCANAKNTGWVFSPDALYYQLLENPYLVEKLAMDKATEISRRYNLSFNQNMIEAATVVRWIDEETLSKGWSCYPLYALMQRYPNFSQLKDVLTHKFQCAIRYNFIYLRYQAEIEDALTEVLRPESLPQTHVSDRSASELCEEQIRGLEMVLSNAVSVVTGPGGTGKTKLIAQMCYELDLRNVPYVISAHAGAAVANIKAAVGKDDDIMTLSRILYKALTKPYRCLIVDEFSMVADPLFARVVVKLMNALPIGVRLRIVMVGDPRQLPPIEWGDVFNQVLASQTIPQIELRTDHRRVRQDGILFKNLQKFVDAEDPRQIHWEWGPDCHFIAGGLPELETLVRHLYQHGHNHKQVTIVSPYKDLDAVNEMCQEVFVDRDADSLMDSFGKVWKLGSRVMLTEKNHDDIKVYNGDEGIVVGLHPEKSCIRVIFNRGQDIMIPTFLPPEASDFDDDDRDRPLSTRDLVLSWAMTIDKAQGSQWKVVICYLRERTGGGFWHRGRMYTAASRTKEQFYVVGRSEYAFTQAIGVDPPKRYNNLAKRLVGEQWVGHWVDPALALNS